jgi:hypothetical protein
MAIHTKLALLNWILNKEATGPSRPENIWLVKPARPIGSYYKSRLRPALECHIAYTTYLGIIPSTLRNRFVSINRTHEKTQYMRPTNGPLPPAELGILLLL